MNESLPTSSFSTSPRASHDEISRRAQELWERYGRPGGRDEEIWLEAERSLLFPAAPVAAQPGPVKPLAAEPTSAKPAKPLEKTSRASAVPKSTSARPPRANGRVAR